MTHVFFSHPCVQKRSKQSITHSRLFQIPPASDYVREKLKIYISVLLNAWKWAWCYIPAVSLVVMWSCINEKSRQVNPFFFYLWQSTVVTHRLCTHERNSCSIERKKIIKFILPLKKKVRTFSDPPAFFLKITIDNSGWGRLFWRREINCFSF